jgi:ribosomal protein S27AE
MGSKPLDSLGDFMRHHYRLRADCLRCKRVAILEPLELLQTCQKRGWSYALAQVEPRLVCSECGAKRVRLGPAFGD